MTEHVYRRFPDHVEVIQALLQRHGTFRDICTDYDEICAWLDHYCSTIGRPSEECDHARQVMRDLEDEINNVLKDAVS